MSTRPFIVDMIGPALTVAAITFPIGWVVTAWIHEESDKVRACVEARGEYVPTRWDDRKDDVYWQCKPSEREYLP